MASTSSRNNGASKPTMGMVSAIKRVVLLLLAFAFAVPTIGLIALTVQYFSNARIASQTIKGWQQDASWRPLNAFPRKVVDALIAVEEPDLRTRTECLTVFRQVAPLSRILYSSTMPDRTLLSHRAALMIAYGSGHSATLIGHVRAILLTHFFDCTIPKDELLEIILNEIYLGKKDDQLIYGFDSGARSFFKKEVSQLSPSEVALLVALVNSPQYFDPTSHPKRAFNRRKYVLLRMANAGIVSGDDASAAENEPLPNVQAEPSNQGRDDVGN